MLDGGPRGFHSQLLVLEFNFSSAFVVYVVPTNFLSHDFFISCARFIASVFFRPRISSHPHILLHQRVLFGPRILFNPT